MSPPIFNPDGSEVSEIVLPDGSTASEVIDPDGNVVFEAGPDIPDSGVSRWTFDNNDLSGSDPLDVWGSNDGVNNGATTGATGITGYDSGEAFSFANGDSVEVFNHPQPTSFSVSFWVNLDSLPTTENRTFGFIGQAEDQNGWIIGTTEANNNRIRFWIWGGSSFYGFNGSTTLTTGTPYHVVGTYDGQTNDAVLYVNNSQDGAGNNPKTTTTNPLYIGRGYGNNDHVNGRIDDPRIYDKALSSTEVSDLYNTGSI